MWFPVVLNLKSNTTGCNSFGCGPPRSSRSQGRRQRNKLQCDAAALLAGTSKNVNLLKTLSVCVETITVIFSPVTQTAAPETDFKIYQLLCKHESKVRSVPKKLGMDTTSLLLLIMKERQGGVSIIDAELAQKLSCGDPIKDVLPGAEVEEFRCLRRLNKAHTF